VRSSLEGGADLVCFSGDKLLGGPQAGIIAGRRDLVDAVRRHPLMRALRVDKLTYAALEATLLEYALGRATTTVPVARAVTASIDQIRERAAAMAERLRASSRIQVEIVGGASKIGGGSAPATHLPTFLLALSIANLDAVAVEQRLRAGDPPVIARIEKDRVVLDLRTVLPDEDEQLVAVLEGVGKGLGRDSGSGRS
jgi:L-seryl-tRNA(Ser) seleniumtransferase